MERYSNKECRKICLGGWRIIQIWHKNVLSKKAEGSLTEVENAAQFSSLTPSHRIQIKYNSKPIMNKTFHRRFWMSSIIILNFKFAIQTLYINLFVSLPSAGSGNSGEKKQKKNISFQRGFITLVMFLDIIEKQERRDINHLPHFPITRSEQTTHRDLLENINQGVLLANRCE